MEDMRLEKWNSIMRLHLEHWKRSSKAEPLHILTAQPYRIAAKAINRSTLRNCWMKLKLCRVTQERHIIHNPSASVICPPHVAEANRREPRPIDKSTSAWLILQTLAVAHAVVQLRHQKRGTILNAELTGRSPQAGGNLQLIARVSAAGTMIEAWWSCWCRLYCLGPYHIILHYIILRTDYIVIIWISRTTISPAITLPVCTIFIHHISPSRGHRTFPLRHNMFFMIHQQNISSHASYNISHIHHWYNTHGSSHNMFWAPIPSLTCIKAKHLRVSCTSPFIRQYLFTCIISNTPRSYIINFLTYRNIIFYMYHIHFSASVPLIPWS
jgi:hypothetical protein